MLSDDRQERLHVRSEVSAHILRHLGQKSESARLLHETFCLDADSLLAKALDLHVECFVCVGLGGVCIFDLEVDLKLSILDEVLKEERHVSSEILLKEPSALGKRILASLVLRVVVAEATLKSFGEELSNLTDTLLEVDLFLAVRHRNNDRANRVDGLGTEFLLGDVGCSHILKDLNHHWHEVLEVGPEVSQHHLT